VCHRLLKWGRYPLDAGWAPAIDAILGWHRRYVAIRCAGNRIFAHTAITPVARAAVRCCSTWPFLAQSRSFSQLVDYRQAG
jgi:hypothetical protein